MYRRSMDEVERFHRHKVCLHPHPRPALSVPWYSQEVRAQKFDIVTATYALSEVPTDQDRERIVEQLWQRVSPGGLLVLVDSGNGWGFHCIQVRRGVSRAACAFACSVADDCYRWPTTSDRA